MAKRAVEVCECDRCGKEPANTWIIIGPDGTPRAIELCDQHAAPIANAYALARPVITKPPRAAHPRTRSRQDETPPAETSTPAESEDSPDTPIVLPKPAPQPIWR